MERREAGGRNVGGFGKHQLEGPDTGGAVRGRGPFKRGEAVNSNAQGVQN